MKYALALLLLASCAAPPASPLPAPPAPPAFTRLGTLNWRTPGRVWAITFLDDDTLAVGAGRTFLLMDARTGVIKRQFRGHAGVVGAIALLPDRKRAITGSGDGTMALWDLESGVRIREYKGHDGRVWSVDLRGDTILSAGLDGTIGLWNLETGERTQTIRRHDGEVRGAGFLSDGRIMSAGADGKVFIGDKKFEGHGEIAGLVIDGDRAMTPVGPVIPTEGPETAGALVLWDLKKEEAAQTRAWPAGVLWAAYAGRGILVGCADRCVYDGATEILRGDRFHPVAARGRLKACGNGSSVAVFEGKERIDAGGHGDGVTGVGFLPDGRPVTVGADGWMIIDQTKWIDTGAMEFGGLALRDGFALTGGWRASPAEWNLEKLARRDLEAVSARAVAWAGAVPVTALLDGRVVVWSDPITTLKGTLVAANETQVLTAEGRIATLTDLATGISCAFTHGVDITSVAMTASGARDGSVVVWSDPLVKFQDTSAVTALAIGRRIATGHADGHVAVWDLAGKKLASWKEHVAPVTSLAFDATGAKLISGSMDTTAIVWTVP